MYSRSSALTFFLDTNHFQTATEINQKKIINAIAPFSIRWNCRENNFSTILLSVSVCMFLAIRISETSRKQINYYWSATRLCYV